MSNKKQLDWDLTLNDDNISLSFSGELTRFTLQPLWVSHERIFSKFKKNSTILWDLSKLSRIDSAGFALLCELLHKGESLSKQQRLINPPKQLLTLADLFGLSNWLSAFLLQVEK